MAVTYMFRLSQLCRPPSTQTPERSSDAVVGAARSNVLVSAAAQHGEGEALRHRRRACAALRGSAAGVLARDERLSRSERRTPTPVFLLPLNKTHTAVLAKTAPRVEETRLKNTNAEYKTNGMGPSATNQENNTNNNLECHQCHTNKKK